MVMFADLGVSFRILATQEVLNVMPIIGNIHLKGIKLFTINQLKSMQGVTFNFL